MQPCYDVRADPTEGEHSLFYAAMGYVRPAERRSGPRRITNPGSSVAKSAAQEENERNGS
jgi:hypothetical protein